jgi:hypothetical protein
MILLTLKEWIGKHVIDEEAKVSDSLTAGLPVIPDDPGIEVMAT